MHDYKKLILSEVFVSTCRMLIGASSTIYMIVSGLNLYQVGITKSFQAIIILVLGFVIGVVSDRIDRKYLYSLAVFFSFIWLFVSYLAGNSVSYIFELFILAELFNALSLSLFQNNSTAYLVDTYNNQFDDNNTKKIFGQQSYLEFLFMSIASLIGGFLYQFLSGELFLFSAVIMLLIFAIGAIYLPNCKVQNQSTDTKQVKFLDKNDFFLILSKFKFYKFNIMLYIVFSLYFQIIIQYWQVIVDLFSLVRGNESILGVVLFLMMLTQSFSGKILEKYKAVSEMKNIFIFFIGLMLCMAALTGVSLLNLVLFIIGICVNLFAIRYLITSANAKIHADILPHIRAKYDMMLNTILRISTALSLVLIGFISDKFGVNVIIYLGFVFGLVSLVVGYNIPKKLNPDC